MIKHYKANTCISVNVVLKSKKSIHVAFTPLSNGGSEYSTDNEEVQIALERHYKFGRLFRLASAENTPSGKSSAVAEKKDTEEEILKVKISDIASAKDYLADKYGISRTSLRTEKSILEAAKAHNVEFEGL